MTETRDYVRAVLRRGVEPMEPVGFGPDWADRPWRHKVYDGVTRIPLPRRHTPTGPVAAVLDPPPPTGAFTVEVLSDLLLHSYGLLARRLAPTGNEDSDSLPWFAYANLGRGTASGGGLYPMEIYWVAGRSAGVPAGIYHYASQHHAMERLLAGDVTDRVRAALGAVLADDTDQFLLLSVKFWKNAFKYNTFCYHVVTSDIGTLLGTWTLWTRSCGLPLPATLWFAEPDLNDLLGLETAAESVFAVVPLRWAGGEQGTRAAAALGAASVTLPERERSARVLRFDWTDRVHRANVHSGPRPVGDALRAAVPTAPSRAQCVPLPASDLDLLRTDVRTALRERRSSFGRFSAVPKMTAAELSAVLAIAASGRRLETDVSRSDDEPLTRLAVFVNHVADVPSGVYDYDPDGARLGLVDGRPPGPFLQTRYFLNNYNLEQAAAVLAVVARPEAVLAAVGDRGYRVLNVEVGAVTQATYTGAAAVGVGCGAIFGFENVAVRERLGCADDEWPIVLILLGHERTGQAGLDHRLA